MKTYYRCFTTIIFCAAFLWAGISEAGHSDYYANLIRDGKYCIAYKIDYGSNYNDGNDQKGQQSVVFLEDREKGVKYFSFYQRFENHHILQQILEYNKQTYSDYHTSKKEIRPEEVQKRVLKTYDESAHTNWGNFMFFKTQAMRDLFTCLADITEKNNLLKNYKAEYISSGTYKHDGVQYDYDEYAIKLPKEYGLKIYYQDGKIYRCVKLGNDQLYDHPFLFSEKIKSDSVNVISFAQFNDDTETMVKDLLGRIGQEQWQEQNGKKQLV